MTEVKRGVSGHDLSLPIRVDVTNLGGAPADVAKHLRELLDAGALELRPEFARKFYENVFGRAEQSATICICGAKYAKGDRCRAKLCQVAAGFMDTVDPAIVASLSVVPAEQCPNCAHVDTECQCGDLRDCW